MPPLLLTALLLSGFYRHTHLSSLTNHQAHYDLSYMPPADITDQNYTRQYLVNPNMKFQCAWNTTLLNQWPPAVVQDSLLFDMDFNTLWCQPFTPPISTSATLVPEKLVSLGNNMAVMAFVQNGSTSYQFPMNFTANFIFTLALNRTILSTGKGIPGLPWEIQVFASVLPPSADFSIYYKNTFTILDPYSDPYFSWDYGTVTDWSTVKTNQGTPNVIYPLKNPCAPQVYLFIIPGQNGDVFIGKSWKKSLDPASIKWYKQNLGANCNVIGAAGFVRFIVLQTTCGYFVSNALSIDLFDVTNIRFNTVATTTTVSSSSRVVKFIKVPNFGTTGLGDLVSGGSGSWCYLRRNIQPSFGTDYATNTAGTSDWVSVKDAITSQWSLVKEPLNVGHLIQVIGAFNFNLTASPKPNAAYTKKLFADIQAVPDKIVTAFVHTPTSTYYFLYKKAVDYSLYSQALADTMGSLSTARLIYNFAPSDDPPKRIIVHPTGTDIFILGDYVTWYLSNTGTSLVQIFDLRKWNPTTATIGSMLFAQNGTLTYFVTAARDKIYRGNSYYGGYIPTGIVDGSTSIGVLIDVVGGMHLLSTANNTNLLTTQVDKTYIDLSATPSPLQPSEYLTGYFSVLPFTREKFMLVEWTTAAAGQPVISQFSPADVGRILVQVSASSTGGKGHIVGYGRFDQSTPWPTSTGATSMRPVSYLLSSSVAPFILTAQSSVALIITVTNAGAVSLSPIQAVGSTVFVETQNPDGSIFRGSFLTTDATGDVAMVLLTPGKMSSITVPASDWKVLQMSSALSGAALLPITNWYMQDHWTCPYEFLANQSTIGPWDHHMDRGDKWNLTIVMRRTKGGVVRKTEGNFMPDYLIHKAGNPWRLHVRSEMLGSGASGWNLTYQIEEIGSDFNQDNTVISLSFRMGNPTMGCGIEAAVPVTVISGCLRGMKMSYRFPDGEISDEEWDSPIPTMLNKLGDFVVGPIPVNYRPPSAAGVAFPTTRILYNADSTQPYKEHFSHPQDHKPDFGCTDANPYNCIPADNCTDAQRRNPFYINCINRTVYLPYPGDHLFKLHISSHFRDAGPLDPSQPLQVNELNGRTDFEIKSPDGSENDVLPILQWLAASPNYANAQLYVSNSTIKFIGTGLYHFQIQPAFDYSYCSNSAYLTFWLYAATLPFPMAQVCLCAMGLVVALWLFRALRVSGENTLVDYRRYSMCRPPDRIPLRDEYLDVEEWDELDLEAEFEAMNSKLVVPDVEADASKSNVQVD